MWTECCLEEMESTGWLVRRTAFLNWPHHGDPHSVLLCSDIVGAVSAVRPMLWMICTTNAPTMIVAAAWSPSSFASLRWREESRGLESRRRYRIKDHLLAIIWHSLRCCNAGITRSQQYALQALHNDILHIHTWKYLG